MEEIKIPLSKTKTILIIAGSIAFVAIGIWLWSIADQQIRNPPTLIKALSIVAILFFGACAVAGLIKLFDRRPGLIINANGIQDNGSISTGRFIAWKNITGIEEIAINRTKIILIHINNIDETIVKESKWKQKMMRFSIRSYGTPISVASGTLKITSYKLLELLTDARIIADKQL